MGFFHWDVMQALLSAARRELQLWQAESALVQDEATAANLRRGRVLCPLLALANAIGVFVLAVDIASQDRGANAPWQWALLWAQVAMCCCMAVFGLVSHTLQHAYRAASTRWLIHACVVAGMLISIFIVATDQWVTPNITAYVLPSMLIGVAVYLQPSASVLLYGASYLVFFIALGWTQGNPEQLLSNRLNGLMTCVMGWGVSVVLWRNFIAMTKQQSQLARVNAELHVKQRDLERLTRLDGLTGLYNRNTFVELTRQELARAQRQGSATSILLLDLDHFKRVNDTWGHPAGDAVLKHVASLLNATVRNTDLVGRLGGEEFIILLPATSPVAARKLAEKVRARLESETTVWEGTSITATASIGLAGTAALENRDFESLYTDADKALYLAKQRGRNQVI